MSKKSKEKPVYGLAMFAIYLRTPEGIMPMKHKFLGMDQDTRDVFALAVNAIISIMGYDPGETGLEMCITPVDDDAKSQMSHTGL